MTPEDWPDLSRDFHTQRAERLKHLELVSEITEPNLEFIEITVNANGEFFEVWKNPGSMETRHVPYNPGGLPYERD